MNISIVIPAFNEEKRIKKSLINIANYCKNNFKKYEIIVVDDASTDKTHKIISKLKIKNLKILRNYVNKGKGYSVKRGILKSKYSLVLFTDSDSAIPINHLEKFIKYIECGYHIVIASKYIKGSHSDTKQSFYRIFIGKIFSLIVNLFVLKGFKDTQCGFKLFKTDIAKKIVKLQTCDRFAFDVELLLIAKKIGIKIKEAPVNWINEKGTRVHPIYDSIEMLIEVIKFKINDLRGDYNLK